MPLLVVEFNTDLYPYVRTTHRQQFVDDKYQKYRAAKRLIYQATIHAMLESDIGEQSGIPLRGAIFVVVPQALHRRDLSNVLKGIEDGAQGAAYKNDAWFDNLAAQRVLARGIQYGLFYIQPSQEGPARFSDWLAIMEDHAEGQLRRKGGTTFHQSNAPTHQEAT